jgi:hypothetical protein
MPIKKEEENVNSNSEKIEIEKNQYDSLMKRLEKLENAKDDDNIPVIGGEEEEREFFCNVMSYKNRPIVGLEKVVQIGMDAERRPQMSCTVIVREKDGKDTKYEDVNYLKLLDGKTEKCKILDIQTKIRTEKGEIVREKIWDESRQSEKETGNRVRLAINHKETIYKVQWHDEIIEMKELNIPK